MRNTRDCKGNNNYPIYPVVPPYGMPMYNGFNGAGMNGFNNTGMVSGLDQQLSALEQQVNSLEQRVNRLENMNQSNNYNKYNDSNYYMV